MTLIFIRVFFLILSSIVGYQIGSMFSAFGAFWPAVCAVLGFFCAGLIIFFELGMRKVSISGLSAAVFGLIFGLIIAKLISDSFLLKELSKTNEVFGLILQVVLTLVFCYLGMTWALRGKDEFNIIIPYVKFARQDQREEFILLDTSVIIDGRIADIFQTKFLEGKIVIPRFILRELQQIADSQDSIKRNRGRRGLDILNRIQKDTKIDVKIHEEDIPEIQEVDAKLVKLAKMLNAKVLTNDYNLNKIAELQGVKVLNINELANALRPVVLPGEIMEVRVIKEGKEYNQGIAYLDDGTMVVVDNGKQLIGQSIRVVVTSVLQTAAGRMIFSKPEGS